MLLMRECIICKQQKAEQQTDGKPRIVKVEVEAHKTVATTLVLCDSHYDQVQSGAILVNPIPEN